MWLWTKTHIGKVALVASVCLLGLPVDGKSWPETGELIFAASVGQGQGDLVRDSGARLTNICGPSAGWDVLMPDGRNFDASAIGYIDKMVIDADEKGLKVLLRVQPGGGAPWSFKAISNRSLLPVDLTEYSDAGPTKGYKDGEYLGPKVGGLAAIDTSFPPRVLTDDTPGNTSPWYDFCYAIASRYNGTTPDPRRPGKYLPKVEYFSTVGEMDTLHYWYGTSAEYFGRPDPKGAIIGLLPTLYRAVKAANPDAKVIDGGFVCYNVGWYMVYEMAQEQGAVTKEVLAYNNRYFRYAPIHTFPFPSSLAAWLDSPVRQRSRLFIDKCFESQNFWDIFCFHSYEDYLMHDTIGFFKSKMAQYGIDKPIWARELTAVNDLFSSSQPESDTAARTLKKFVGSFAEGVQVCTVAPFVAIGGTSELAWPGLYRSGLLWYRLFNPTASISTLQQQFGTLLLKSFKLLTMVLSDCRVENYVLNGDAALYVFTNSSRTKRVAIGWTENPSDQIAVADHAATEGFRPVALYDHLGNQQGASIPSSLSTTPFVLVLQRSLGAKPVPIEAALY